MPSAADRRDDLVALFHEVRGCSRCPLAETRTQVVFGAGNADAELMFVGEAPGAQEDLQGIPFVGRAGGLLDDLLAENGFERSDVFIANVLKSRPPGNRDPRPEEIATCKPYLLRQVELIEPTVICTLGNFATKLLTRSEVGISRVHGAPQTHAVGELLVHVFPLYHPAAGLRDPKVKELLRQDFAQLPALLNAGPPQRRPVVEREGVPEEPVTEGIPAGAPAPPGGSGQAADARDSEQRQADEAAAEQLGLFD